MRYIGPSQNYYYYYYYYYKGYFSVIPPPPTRKFVKLLKLFLRKWRNHQLKFYKYLFFQIITKIKRLHIQLGGQYAAISAKLYQICPSAYGVDATSIRIGWGGGGGWDNRKVPYKDTNYSPYTVCAVICITIAIYTYRKTTHNLNKAIVPNSDLLLQFLKQKSVQKTTVVSCYWPTYFGEYIINKSQFCLDIQKTGQSDIMAGCPVMHDLVVSKSLRRMTAQNVLK